MEITWCFAKHLKSSGHTVREFAIYLKRSKMSTSYSEKLKDPRWQKKRLNVFNRDKFTCQICGDSKNTLNVHHLSYSKGKEPWNYDDINLITLCNECHDREHDFSAQINDLIESIRSRGVTSIEILSLLETVDEHLYLEDNRIIQSICGDESGAFEEDIKNLADRRDRLVKKTYSRKKRNKKNEPF